MNSDSDENEVDGSLKTITGSDIHLRPYQVAGVNWLRGCYSKGHGSILGDEMGLGKTCQTIAFLAYVRKGPQQSIVVCPRSLLENWQEEISRFAPSLKVQCYVGNKEKRQELAHRITKEHRKGERLFHILITTYELCLKDDSFLSSLDWQVMVVDEAHRLKNSESLLYRTLSQWDVDHTVLLTGTPVQNNLDELYSLLSFIAPKTFRKSGKERFVEKYEDVTKSKGVTELHDLLKPYLLRRTKEAVLKDLPVKTEIVMYHGISALQKKLYKAILTKDVSVFENPYKYGGGSPRLMNILMQLRKCVNHPYLFDGVEPEPFALGEHLVEVSGKLVLIDRLLSYCQTTGHKVLIFSQMTHMLDILQDYLGYREYTYERLDGSVRGEERFLAVQNFNKNEDTFVFLLSTKAGGQGLNLVAADTVIFVDSDFNPQNDLQAAARAHRIGQKRPVKIIRLVGRNTVEEIILKRAEEKLKLTEKVIEEGEFSLGASKESLIADKHVPLQDILKFGVDTLLNEDDSTDQDIDFTEMLGSTVNGEWQVEEDSNVKEEDDVMEDQPSSMYVFEGTDYSKEPSAADKKAFDDLIANEKIILEEQVLGERSMRKKTSTLLGPLPDVAKKTRKQLTPEELEERNLKRKEAAEKRAKQAEEERIRRAHESKKKMEAMWKANDYVSSCVTLDSDDDEDDDEEIQVDLSDDDNDVNKDRSIHYISGDVTHPVNCDTDVNLIVHCVDDSGRWGSGGLFTAISRRSPAPQEQYEKASKMKDIALGDCHLISLDDTESRRDVEDWLTLIIAQHRDKKNNLSGIKLSALSNGLKNVYKLAKARKGSVHLPRIGYDTPGFNWYGTERLIRKHLAAKGIPTYIYYYPRKKHNKRKSDDDDGQPEKAKKKRVHMEPFTSKGRGDGGHTSHKANGTSSVTKLPNVFRGVAAYIHPAKFSTDEMKRFKRHLIAYDGDIETTLCHDVTHVIVHPSCNSQDILGINEEISDCHIVTSQWLTACLRKGKLAPVSEFKHPETSK